MRVKGKKMSEEELAFTDFIASVIHDMKNSLNMQIHGLEKVAEECRDRGNDGMSDRLGPLIYEANRMDVNLIQLLSLYKMDKSIYLMDVAEHQVREVIAEALMQDESIMSFRHIQVSIDCDEDCFWFFDRDLITGVLVNALNNAYKYTREKIRVAGKIEGDMLELRIEDDGEGYPPSMLQDGVSANKRSNFSTGSTGLGFYFSSRVARMHKNAGRTGSLTIENGGGYGGGCFVVKLP